MVFVGAVVGFISWLFALAMPMLIYGSNTLFFFIYTAFLSGADARRGSGGDALHSLMDGKLRYSIVFTDDHRHYVWRTVYLATGLCTFLSPLFIIQTVTNNVMFCTPRVYVTMDKCGTFARVIAVSPTEDVESSSDAWDDDAVFQGAGWVN